MFDKRQQKQVGFTLIELMVTLLILSVVAAFAAPSFTGPIKRNQLTSNANDVAGFLRYARAEAVSSGEIVVVSNIGSDGSFGSSGNTGLVAWYEKTKGSSETPFTFTSGSDIEIRRISYSGNPNFKITPAALSQINFFSDGWLSNLPSGSAQVLIAVCDDSNAKTITILKTGIIAVADGGSCSL